MFVGEKYPQLFEPSTTANLDTKLSNQIENVIKLYDVDAENLNCVIGFLAYSKEFIPILNEAKPRLMEKFGQATFKLHVEPDPEEDFKFLVVTVKVNMSPEKAYGLLDQFREEWVFRQHALINFIVDIEPHEVKDSE